MIKIYEYESNTVYLGGILRQMNYLEMRFLRNQIQCNDMRTGNTESRRSAEWNSI